MERDKPAFGLLNSGDGVLEAKGAELGFGSRNYAVGVELDTLRCDLELMSGSFGGVASVGDAVSRSLGSRSGAFGFVDKRLRLNDQRV